MQFRSILSGTFALLLLSTGAMAAQDRGSATPAVRPSVGLPGVFGGTARSAGQDVKFAQAADPRVTELEEQIRQLNGTIEELNFQVLQMQEQMRKMQEDNEYRFQELEKRSDAGGKSDRSVARNGSPRPGEEAAPANRDAVASAIGKADQGAGMAGVSTRSHAQAQGKGKPPVDFGTITFDAKGNVVGETRDSMAGKQAPPASADDTKVAALPSTDDPEELYRNSYEFILSGDYSTAEAGFRDHIERFPDDPKAADAHYWLGESLLGQQKYRDAAEVFLAANKSYPASKKAPDMLLKLGVSLAGLKQRDVACATYAEVAKRYPDAPGQLKQRLKQEEALASC
jgi:tol-pal system protein YbgF